MTNLFQTIYQQVGLKATVFPPSSRYHGIETARLELANNGTVVYLRRRFVPPSERFSLQQEHVVVQGDRLDNITAHYLGDPEQFWQICDANGTIHPDELTEGIGSQIRITLPEGIPGNKNV